MRPPIIEAELRNDGYYLHIKTFEGVLINRTLNQESLGILIDELRDFHHKITDNKIVKKLEIEGENKE